MKIAGFFLCLCAGVVLAATGYEILFESFDTDDMLYLLLSAGLMAYGIHTIRDESAREKK